METVHKFFFLRCFHLIAHYSLKFDFEMVLCLTCQFVKILKCWHRRKKKKRNCAPSDITAQTLISPIIVVDVVVFVVVLRLFSYIIPLCVYVCVFFFCRKKNSLYTWLILAWCNSLNDIDAGSISASFWTIQINFRLTWIFSSAQKSIAFEQYTKSAYTNNAKAYIIG